DLARLLVADVARQERGAPACIDGANLWANLTELSSVGRNRQIAQGGKEVSPPHRKSVTRGMAGFGESRIRPCSSSIGNPTTPRPSYCPSCADWSPPVQKALSPAPVSTRLQTFRSFAASWKA